MSFYLQKFTCINVKKLVNLEKYSKSIINKPSLTEYSDSTRIFSRLIKCQGRNRVRLISNFYDLNVYTKM